MSVATGIQTEKEEGDFRVERPGRRVEKPPAELMSESCVLSRYLFLRIRKVHWRSECGKGPNALRISCPAPREEECTSCFAPGQLHLIVRPLIERLTIICQGPEIPRCP